jgi:hypothetical protein
MAQKRWPTLVPLGALAVATQGTTILLSLNCGPLQGKTPGPDYNDPPVPGTPLRQIILTATGNDAVLMPRGSTFTGNPENVIAYLPKGVPVAIPFGQPFEGGILPENFCLDIPAASASTVYGCGVIS